MNTQLHNLTPTAKVQVILPKEPHTALCFAEPMSCVAQLGTLFSPTFSTPSTR